MNTVYNRYDINQQSNDDLRVLTTTKEYTDVLDNKIMLPVDYVHLLNCIVTITTNTRKTRCNPEGVCSIEVAAKRITSDRYAGILNNYYLKPSAKRPYYMLKSDDGLVAVPYTREAEEIRGDVVANTYNSSLEIKCGDGTVSKISIDYVRAPQKIELEYDDIENIEDNTPQLEFPDYVCYEIVNIFTKLLMENAGDPRLQTNLAVNQTISTGATA